MAEWESTIAIDLPSEAATIALAQGLASRLHGGGVVYLRGELGAGKTTFARALLRELGAGERIKSPTYSLLERYRVGERDAFHLDLYRIAGPAELEWLGLDELCDPRALVLIEWPERGIGALPPSDLEIALEHGPLNQAGNRRAARLLPCSKRGSAWLEAEPRLRNLPEPASTKAPHIAE